MKTELKDPQKFEELMLKIDRALSYEGYSIPNRPIQAVGVVAKKFDITLPLTDITLPLTLDLSESIREAYKNRHITNQIHSWYQHRYGDRLKIDLSPGRMAFMIEQDIWIFKFPRVWGSAKLIASKTIESATKSMKGEPVTHNVLDSIQNLTVEIRSTFTDEQLSKIFDDFVLGHKTLTILGYHNDEDLIKLALADISSAIDHILIRNPEFGLSKWSSLQASEKLIKAAIRHIEGIFSNTHDLKKLIREASSSGLTIDAEKEIALIQCTPGIRYGEEPCSQTDAVQAHKAVLELAHKIIGSLNWDPSKN